MITEDVDLGKNLNEQEEILIKTIIKRSETECIKCVMWDEVAKNYGKRGMCEECFNANHQLINSMVEP